MPSCRLTRAYARKTLSRFDRKHKMPGGCHFELADVRDLDVILDIACETFKSDQPTRAGMRHFLTRAHALIFLMKSKNGTPIGYLHLEGNARNKSVYVNTFVLRPDWRGKGLGTYFYLLQDAAARDAGFYSIRMHVAEYARNNLHLALKNGYEKIWFGPYLDDGSNSYLLRKKFPANVKT